MPPQPQGLRVSSIIGSMTSAEEVIDAQGTPVFWSLTGVAPRRPQVRLTVPSGSVLVMSWQTLFVCTPSYTSPGFKLAVVPRASRDLVCSVLYIMLPPPGSTNGPKINLRLCSDGRTFKGTSQDLGYNVNDSILAGTLAD